MGLLSKLIPFFNNNHISKKQIAQINMLISEIKRLSIRYEDIEQSRIRLESEISNLQLELDPTFIKKMDSVEKMSIKDLDDFKKEIDTQISIIALQIEVSQKLIQDEYNLLIYQIQRSIHLFKDYILILNELITNKELVPDKSLKEDIEQTVIILQKLTNNALLHLKNELNYYGKLINANPNFVYTEQNIIVYLENRQSLENQIDEKINQSLDKINLVKLNPWEVHHNFMEILKEIINLCDKRLKFSDEIILAAFNLQSELYHKLETIKNSLELTQIKLVKKLNSFAETKKISHWKTKKLIDNIEKFNKYALEFKSAIETHKVNLGKRVQQLKASQTKNIQELRNFNKDEEREINPLNWYNPFAKIVTGVLLALSLAACGSKPDPKYVSNLTEVTNSSSQNLIKENEKKELVILNFSSEKAACAEYIKKVYDKIYGKNMSIFTGVSGNAWDFPKNISFLGGKIIWKDSEKNDFNMNILQMGDIIGFKYKFSSFLETARSSGEEFTHLMIVVSIKNGEPVFAHFYKPGKSALKGNKDLLFVSGERIDTSVTIKEMIKRGLFIPKKIMRANHANSDYRLFNELENNINHLNRNNLEKTKKLIDYFKKSKYHLALNDTLSSGQKKVNKFESSVRKTAVKIAKLQNKRLKK